VYDYVDGKADWMAYGLPVEGDDGPFLGQQVTAVATCGVTLSVADAREVLQSTGAEVVVLLHDGGLAVGEVDAEAMEGHEGHVKLLDMFRPVPSTVRPSVTLASVADGGGGERLVTTSDGRLLGGATVAPASAPAAGDAGDHDHEGHDHEGHDHGASSVDMDRYERELTEVMKALEERYGDSEPAADELRAFLHSRLVAEGRSAEEADRFLDDMEVGDDG